jgi:bacillithiol system protein YtxJ
LNRRLRHPKDAISKAELEPVPDLNALDNLFEYSNEVPVVLFLNDPFCPISARAHGRVTEAGGAIHMIDVSRQHELNREVEARTGVRHESPQAFVLRRGRPIWHASHGRISTESLAYARDFELDA